MSKNTIIEDEIHFFHILKKTNIKMCFFAPTEFSTKYTPPLDTGEKMKKIFLLLCIPTFFSLEKEEIVWREN